MTNVMADSKSSSYRSQKATVATLSFGEKLDIVPAIFSVLGNVVFATATGGLRSKEKRPKSYFRYVALTALRTFTSRTSVRQQNFLAPPTDDGYAQACKSRGQKPNSEILEDGTRAHWIGDPKAEKLIINFHGGGFVFPAPPEFFEFMFQCVDRFTKEGKSVACLFLSYDLAPGAIYPRQLQQAAMLMNHVTQNLKRSPSDIILAGDSAGGNLALQLLSHISHPHPSTTIKVPEVKINAPFKGLLLISPWTSFDTSTDSFTRNHYKDCINSIGGKKWSTAFMNSPWPHTSNSDPYNQAITAPEEWWNDFQVEETFIICGEEEVLVDGIKSFEAKFRRGAGEENVKFRCVEGEYHDQAYLDLQFGYKEKEEGVQAKEIKGWIGSKL